MAVNEGISVMEGPHRAVTFVDKDIQPYDRIHLPTHEIISPETLRSAELDLSKATSKQTASQQAIYSLP